MNILANQMSKYVWRCGMAAPATSRAERELQPRRAAGGGHHVLVGQQGDDPCRGARTRVSIGRAWHLPYALGMASDHRVVGRGHMSLLANLDTYQPGRGCG
jgi:hypothetical protein